MRRPLGVGDSKAMGGLKKGNNVLDPRQVVITSEGLALTPRGSQVPQRG